MRDCHILKLDTRKISFPNLDHPGLAPSTYLYLPLQPGLGVAAVEEEDGDAGVGEGPLGAGRGRRHPRRRARRVVEVGHAPADRDGRPVAAEARLDRSSSRSDVVA